MMLLRLARDAHGGVRVRFSVLPLAFLISHGTAGPSAAAFAHTESFTLSLQSWACTCVASLTLNARGYARKLGLVKKHSGYFGSLVVPNKFKVN